MSTTAGGGMRVASRLIPALLAAAGRGGPAVTARVVRGGTPGSAASRARQPPAHGHGLGSTWLRAQPPALGRRWFVDGRRGVPTGSGEGGAGKEGEGAPWGEPVQDWQEWAGVTKPRKPHKQDFSSKKKLKAFYKSLRWNNKMNKKRVQREKEVDGDQASLARPLREDEEDVVDYPHGIEDPLTCPITDLFGLEDPEFVLPVLQEDIETVLARVAVPKEKQLLQRRLVDQINDQVKEMFGPSARLMPFGSLVAGLGTKDSDLDIQVTLGQEWEETIERVRLKDLAKRVEEAKEKLRERFGDEADQEFFGQGQQSEMKLDVDMSWKEEDNKDVVENKQNILRGVARRLRTRLGLEVRAILKTRVPILRILPNEASDFLSMDISVARTGNAAVHTARFLKIYTKLDPRVKQLVLIVKTWAKRRGILESYLGMLSSYSLTLMVIHVLQSVRPQVVPSLFKRELLHPEKVAAKERAASIRAKQLREKRVRNVKTRPHEELDFLDLERPIDEMEDESGMILLPEEPFSIVSGSDGRDCEINYHTDLEALNGWGDRNIEGSAQLLIRFFAYFANSYEWEETCISVRNGKAQPLKGSDMKKPQHRPFNSAGFCLFVEDPFDPLNNVARYVDNEGLHKIKAEFNRAVRLIQEPEGCRRVFQSLKAQKLVSSEEEEEAERNADRRRVLLARLRGIQTAHQIIRNMGGEPDPITWEDLERDVQIFDHTTFGKKRHDKKIEDDDSEF